ncbi:MULTISPECIES: hypothetical protein [Tessaracoccus]|uniref:hypothetical protein n=1 Tax=Tessaracoccus TaxID=72763 RepID=UPI001146E943|nr:MULTISPECIES: hypothetical protein [Tessaracoccus]VEP38997.1 hypothetical protein TLA_TLA_00443 [Tessaracoccus lapidicaptus]
MAETPSTAPADTPQVEGYPGLRPEDSLKYYIELWKSSVDVQKHFNDIEWRIRGLALTVATFALGAAGVAAKDGTRMGPISLGSMVLVLGLILWYAFYYVDRYWYHPLLRAAVKEGEIFELAIAQYLPEAHMTQGITANSPQPASRWMRVLAGSAGYAKSDDPNPEPGHEYVMKSDHKLRWFYRVGAFALSLAALALEIVALIAWCRVHTP